MMVKMMMVKWSRSLVGIITIFSVQVNPSDLWARVFQNQLITLGDSTAAMVRHAQQMSYDFIIGQASSATRAREGTAAGLGVLFNTGADSAKWMRFNTELTTINGRPITAQDRAKFDIALCMMNPQATKLTDRFRVDSQYAGGRTVIFHPNYYSSSAIDILVAYNIELFHQHGGLATHAGVYVDQVNVSSSSPYPGPCLNPVPKDFATAGDGQLEYIKRLQRYFRDQLGLPMSGNPYRIMHYQSRVPDWVTVEQVRDEYASDLDTLRKLAEDQMIGPLEVAQRWTPEDKVQFVQPEILGAELVLTNGCLHILKHGGAEVVYHFQPPWVKQAPGAYLARGENRPGGPHAGTDLVVYVEPLAPTYHTALELKLTFEPEGLRARLKATGRETEQGKGPQLGPGQEAIPRD